MAPSPKIFPWYYTPATPDLGCFVRNEHPFQLDSNFFLWNEFPPWEIVGGGVRFIPHQLYFRVKCGKAAFHQRVRVWMAGPGSGSSPPPFTGVPPDYVLGGAFTPSPSDWQKFPVQPGEKDYWFAGEHKPPTASDWRRDAAVGHSYDRYDNGTLSTVGWDDTGGDRDFNDIVLEVAVVYRRFFFDELEPFAFTAKEVAYFKREILPKLRASPKAPPASAK
jgi:hypothetical protein